jgi:hypothetical protein
LKLETDLNDDLLFLCCLIFAKGDFGKAEKLYSNGCIILEQLLAMTPHSSDKVFLSDALQRFVQRIVFVNQQIEAENHPAP